MRFGTVRSASRSSSVISVSEGGREETVASSWENSGASSQTSLEGNLCPPEEPVDSGRPGRLSFSWGLFSMGVLVPVGSSSGSESGKRGSGRSPDSRSKLRSERCADLTSASSSSSSWAGGTDCGRELADEPGRQAARGGETAGSMKPCPARFRTSSDARMGCSCSRSVSVSFSSSSSSSYCLVGDAGRVLGRVPGRELGTRCGWWLCRWWW